MKSYLNEMSIQRIYQNNELDLTSFDESREEFIKCLYLLSENNARKALIILNQYPELATEKIEVSFGIEDYPLQILISQNNPGVLSQRTARRLIKHLVKFGADINKTTIKDITPLGIVCEYTKIQAYTEDVLILVEFFLKLGADINKYNRNNDVSCFEILMYNFNPKTLLLSIYPFAFKLVGLFLEFKADFDKNFSPLFVFISNIIGEKNYSVYLTKKSYAYKIFELLNSVYPSTKGFNKEMMDCYNQFNNL